jgi:cytidylate kinase
MSHDPSPGISQGGPFSPRVESACRHWEGRRQAVAARSELPPRNAPAFTITLAREAGTQGSLVAGEVGRLLGWHVYDHELLEQIALDMGLRTALLESVDERHQGWLRESVEADLAALASGNRAPWASESAYVHHLIRTIRALGAHGECVIVGRGAAFILPPETTLRVRLVGPLKERVAALGRRLGVSEREAAAKLRTLDRERNDFVHDHWAKDPADASHYDLVLGTNRLSVHKLAELIVETLRRL